MKNFTILFFLSLLLSHRVIAQPWEPFNIPGDPRYLIDFAVVQGTPFAVFNNGLFRGNFGGQQWEKIRAYDAEASGYYMFAVNYENNKVYFNGNTDSIGSRPIYESPDLGKTWKKLPVGDIRDMAFIGDTLYFFENYNLFSLFGANTPKKALVKWPKDAAGLIQDLAAEGTHLWIMTRKGVYHSPDAGYTWHHSLKRNIPQVLAGTPLIFPMQGKVYCHSKNINPVFRSDDQGISWQEIPWSQGPIFRSAKRLYTCDAAQQSYLLRMEGDPLTSDTIQLYASQNLDIKGAGETGAAIWLGTNSFGIGYSTPDDTYWKIANTGIELAEPSMGWRDGFLFSGNRPPAFSSDEGNTWTMPPFEITSSYDDPPIKVGGDYFVRFSDFDNFGLNVPGSTTMKLGRIVLKKPVVQNMAWNAVVALVDDTKSRLKTLNLSSTTAYLEAVFNTAGCIKGVSIVSLEMTPESPLEDCFPTLEAIPDPFVLCEPQIFGELATESGLGLADATVTLTPISGSCSTPCSADTKTSTDAPNAGNYSFCPCFTCTKFEVSSGKNNDPLNGVSTFDLVLINKHILGLEPLGSPYKIISADANKSRAITTIDIVELRKLILGIYPTGLPSNTSWRFVDKDYSFPDPADPFTTVFPEKKEVNVSSSGSAQEANFVAIKVGDVNNNAITSAQARPVTSVARMQSGAAARAGEIITVPVTYTGTESLEAIQLGIRFDPAVLRLIGPSQGDLPHFNAGNFGLTHVEQGEIRSLWFADPTTPGEALRNGDILFYLSFQVKRHLPASAVLFDLDDKILPNAAWKPEGTEFALQSGQAAEDRAPEAILAASSLKAVCQPNPTTGTAQLKVHADRAGSARLAIFGPFGRREWMKEVELNPGEQIFEIPEVAQLSAGVYFWKVLAPWGKTQGHLIKQ